MTTPKSILITGRRWFHKGPGNTYHSAKAYVDGQCVASIDYSYGYGNQYEWNMWIALSLKGIVNPEKFPNGGTESPFRYCDRHNITYATEVCDVQRKQDL